MSTPKPPEPERGSVVTSLVDRLPPARRARLLSKLSLQEHVSDRNLLAQLGKVAEYLETSDVDETLAVLERAPADFPGRREARSACRALLAMRRYLRNDRDGAFAEWAAVIEEDPEHAAQAYLLRSMVRAVRGELEEALSDVNRGLELAPTDGHAYARRGDIYQRMGRHAEAGANYLRAVQLDPDDVNALVGMGACLSRAEDRPRAIQWFTRAIRRVSDRPDLYIRRALCFEDEGQLAEAVADLDAAIALDPEDAESFHARGRCRPEGQRAEAIADFSRAIALDPTHAAAFAARGRAHLYQGDFDAALADASRALELDPTLSGALFTRALVHHRRGDIARAVEDYDEAAKLAPTEPLYATARAAAHVQLDDSRALRAALDALVVLRPESAEFRAMRARLLAQEGALEQALDDFGAALALGAQSRGASSALADDTRAKLHHERAEALRDLGRFNEAAQDEEQAVLLAPDAAVYRAWLGMYRSKSEGQEHLAEAELTRAVELAPLDPVIRFQRAVYYDFVERWDAALADLDRVIELAPATGVFYFRRGAMRWQGSDDPAEIRAAIADYDRAIELDGEEAEVLRWRAEAHRYLGDLHAALGDLERSLALEPDSGEAFYTRHLCKKKLGDMEGAREDLARAAELGWPDALEACEEPT